MDDDERLKKDKIIAIKSMKRGILVPSPIFSERELGIPDDGIAFEMFRLLLNESEEGNDNETWASNKDCENCLRILEKITLLSKITVLADELAEMEPLTQLSRMYIKKIRLCDCGPGIKASEFISKEGKEKDNVNG
jgi:hypothetical protein